MNLDCIFPEIEKLKESSENFVIVTIVNALGSIPQEIGAKLLVTEQGYYFGTIGGGKLENAAIEKAKQYLKSKISKSYFQDWNLQTDIGMSCGGRVSLFFEVICQKKNWNIVVFGAGHVSQELVHVLLRLDCQVTCIDHRKEWTQKLPIDRKLKIVNPSQMENFVGSIEPFSFVVIATMGHSTDLPILKNILSSDLNLSYLGVIGSVVKAKKIKNELSFLDYQQTQIQNIFCPIGEKIGNNTPPEIAISIVAQLLKTKDSMNHINLKQEMFA